MANIISFDALPSTVAEINERLLRIESMLKQQYEAKPEQIEEYLTRKQAASLLDVSISTLHTWIHEGKLPAHRISSSIRIKKSDLEKAMKKINV